MSTLDLHGPDKPLRFRSNYLSGAYLPITEQAHYARKALERVSYDTMVGTGLSGALVVPALARELGVHWLIVRKDGDGSHSHLNVEGDLGQKWLFVDDFLASGATLSRVYSRVTERAGNRSTFVGCYLYDTATFRAPGEAGVRMRLRYHASGHN